MLTSEQKAAIAALDAEHRGMAEQHSALHASWQALWPYRAYDLVQLRCAEIELQQKAIYAQMKGVSAQIRAVLQADVGCQCGCMDPGYSTGRELPTEVDA